MNLRRIIRLIYPEWWILAALIILFVGSGGEWLTAEAF